MKKLETLHYLKFIPVDNAIAAHSVNLPGEIHKDPADRIIVSTTRFCDMPLVTGDEKILGYPHVKTKIWIKNLLVLLP